PWNFPFWQVFRFAAPALMAGNVGVLKHAENVPGCAAAIEQVFRDAGFPPGVFTTLMIDRSQAERVIRHPAVRAVTLTGSDRAGFSAPTVLADVQPGMAAFDEETFGPVAAVTPARDVDEAIRLANLSPYGLGASVWTRDLALAERVAADIESGCVFVNGPVK